jgi:hypothetical protein
MKNLRYICAQPRLIYYAWQVEVMINNFIKHGINPNNIDILVAWNPNDGTSEPTAVEMWDKLATHYNNVRFFFYQDTRQQPIRYISSVRPNILKQHFAAYPELKEEAIFYHDCDIVFTKPVNFDHLKEGNACYLSNTNSYINYDYIISKGEDVFDKMCEIVGIPKIIPKLMNDHSGGAQYILKNIDAAYWEKVERDSETLYYEIGQLNAKKKAEDPTHHELQIWCADMWAVLWNLWMRGYNTMVTKDMDFSWGTDTANRWEETSIYHNAGVTCTCGGKFYKANYMNSLPYNQNLRTNNDNCSHLYYQEIKEVEKITCLL